MMLTSQNDQDRLSRKSSFWNQRMTLPSGCRAKLQAASRGSEPPMPVLLTCCTAWVEDGVMHFREDPYERDDPVPQALDS